MGEIRNQEDLELPPRTRRIPLPQPEKGKSRGTTSAHAENTPIHAVPLCARRNYLRARGEYEESWDDTTRWLELPPRTRRIQLVEFLLRRLGGTTSAHAENTAKNTISSCSRRNYLRARGEYGSHRAARLASAELPPRTRRIRDRKMPPPGQKGTTSAHAENTKQLKPGVGKWRNYLRARGEYTFGFEAIEFAEELPPRTRRILNPRLAAVAAKGTTSAHAENTDRAGRLIHKIWNYLRARGEYT